MLGNIPARAFVQMISTIVDNEDIPDDAFRAMVSSSVKNVEGGGSMFLTPAQGFTGVRTYKLVEDDEDLASK